jgi:heavy metal-binding protein
MRLLIPVGCVLLFVAALGAQRDERPAAPSLPPVSQTCVHHPDVVESRPGSCPICKMTLVPVRLDSAWMCPIHSAVLASSAGTCPICGRPLNRVTVSVAWTCRNDPSVERIDPGTCSDGTPMIARRTLRPHGNHNPQHGGQFFMAADNWHHLEGAYPRPGVFRLYLYDDYARPLPADRLKAIRARVVTNEIFDPRTRTTTEVEAFPLRLVREAEYLEARIERARFPLELTAKVKLDAGSDELRFDFTFTEPTRDPLQRSQTARTASQERPSRVVANGGIATPATPATAQPIPSSTQGIVDLLRTRSAEVAAHLDSGDFAAVWVPAFQAKDLALALQPHLTGLTSAQREVAEPALRDFVRAAWLLDAYADAGNRVQIEIAYKAFAAAASDVMSAFGER